MLHSDTKVSVELFKQPENRVGGGSGSPATVCLLLPRSPGDRTHTLRDGSSDSSSKGSTTQLCESKCAPSRRDSKGKGTIK